jgi:AcrR family transcriptional regulator
MGRKSARAERTEQILDAFERCIVKYGLQDTTLQSIADEAGVKRSILRHHIGNRDELVNALFERMEAKYDSRRAAFLNEHRGTQRLESLIEYLVEGWLEFGRDDDTIFEELLAASARDEKLRETLRASYESLEASIADELVRNYRHVPADLCRTVAHAIMCLAFGHSTMLWLGFDRSRYPELQQVIGALLQTLANEERARVVWADLGFPQAAIESEKRANAKTLADDG